MLSNRFQRIPALGARVQIGQFFNGHTRTILTAYPRMFNDDDYNEISAGDTYSVSSYDLFTQKQISFDSKFDIYLDMTQNSL